MALRWDIFGFVVQKSLFAETDSPAFSVYMSSTYYHFPNHLS